MTQCLSHNVLVWERDYKWMPFGSGLISDANRKRPRGAMSARILVMPTDIISYPFYKFTLMGLSLS